MLIALFIELSEETRENTEVLEAKVQVFSELSAEEFKKIAQKRRRIDIITKFIY